ncbi:MULTISPECIES: recombinase family protein [Bacillus]|uniref:recombinase family protein n=1 Tax=Bacillus TaxID=1386 RepID=UPI00034D545B|nr:MULTISPECIES: recombinase family protein [Bacillus cereus group]PEB07798.1 recombinase family protein [Bacillus cereus]AWC31833.1 recombinase family protein [Bacillus cytotoxicus]AWC35871.1 recombinase family protein [Bacillus cytotoxicus]AWC60111.1 recombinase family protein [Bacillus cytotoxicus]KMT50331.1 recombinase [Bacillus cytotoxicus]
MRCAIYARVSTEEQAVEGYSISAQKKKLTAYCETQDWDVVGYYVDEGISAKNTNRPELIRMIDHIKKGLIDCVLVYRLDRLTRSVLDLYNLLDVFEKYDCKFKSATEVYDTTTAIGRLFITIIAALAQWERENIGERVRVGQQEKVRQGKYTSGRKPYGYNADHKEGVLTVIEEEAKIVRSVFNDYLKGHSAQRICKKLNTIGTPGRDYWNEKAILYILENPLYVGTLRWRKETEHYFEIPNSVPAIIEKELFDNVQRLREARRESHPRSAYGSYIFSGIIKCPRCGRSLVGNYVTSKKKDGTITKYKQYFCRGRKLNVCSMGSMSERKLEKAIIPYILSLHIHATDDDVSTGQNTIEDDIIQIKNELKVIEKRRKKWQYAWANEHLKDEEFTELMQEESDREKVLTEELYKLKPAENKKLKNNELKEILNDMKLNWNNLNDEEKKMLLQIILKRIVVERSDEWQAYKLKIVEMEFN